jgi:hypothetical protein
MYLLITEGKVVHRAGDDQEVEDPLENKSVGDPAQAILLLPSGTQTLGSRHG